MMTGNRCNDLNLLIVEIYTLLLHMVDFYAPSSLWLSLFELARMSMEVQKQARIQSKYICFNKHVW